MPEEVSAVVVFVLTAFFIIVFGALFWINIRRGRIFREFLKQEGFLEISQPRRLDEAAFIKSPVWLAQFNRVVQAWEKKTSLGRLHLLFIQSPGGAGDMHGGGGGSKRKTVLEAKVSPSIQDFLVVPRLGSAWADKAISWVIDLEYTAPLPPDVTERYQVFSSHPIEVPSSLFEYLRFQEGLRFCVASSSLLVEARVSKRDGLRQITDPESFKEALSDLESIVPLLTSS